MHTSRFLSLLEKRAFLVLIFLIPSQLVLHFWPSWSFLYGVPIDYLAPKIYLTDILLVLVLLLGAINKSYPNFFKKSVFPLFLSFAFLNTLNSLVPAISFIFWVRIFLFGLFSFYLKKVDTHTIKKTLASSLIFFSILGIAQFLRGGSVAFIFKILGERSFTLSTPGIALGNYFGFLKLRPYSTFGHPNAFAGFLVVTLLLVADKGKAVVSKIAVLLGAIALFLTGSLGAFITSLLVLAIYFFQPNKNHFLMIFFFALLVSFVSPFILSNFFLGLTLPEIEQRVQLAVESEKMFRTHFLFGVGLGNFIPKLFLELSPPFRATDLQPVHNIFLLVLTELGIIGFGLVTFLITALIKQNGGRVYLNMALIAIILTGLFDHYWFTLQQNMLLFFLVVGASLSKYEK